MMEACSNKNFSFKWEFGDFVIQTVHRDYISGVGYNIETPIRDNCPIEICKYCDESHTTRYTVAFWKLDDEGYELRFVGNRPMKDIEPEKMATIWEQICAAQFMLDEYWKTCHSYR